MVPSGPGSTVVTRQDQAQAFRPRCTGRVRTRLPAGAEPAAAAVATTNCLGVIAAALMRARRARGAAARAPGDARRRRGTPPLPRRARARSTTAPATYPRE